MKKTYKPCNKPNHTPKYVHAEFNHPPATLKQTPIGVGKGLNNQSSSKTEFEKNASDYEQYQLNAAYKTKLKFEPDTGFGVKKKKARCRKVTWFNSPYCKGVKKNFLID